MKSGATLLQTLFIALKLLDKIEWPWWQVMLPTIIQVGLIALFGAVYGIFLLLESPQSRARRKAIETLKQWGVK